MFKKKIVWITWENQRRNVSMSSAIGANLFVIDYNKIPAMGRYLLSLMQTFSIIIKECPDVLIVQNPSIVLSLFSIVIKLSKIFRFKLIIDMHNAGVFPLEEKIIFLNKIRDFIVRNSDLAIVTNDELAIHIIDMGGKPIVVEDPLPVFSYIPVKKKLKALYNFLFICSYAEDEPYLEVIDAARMLDEHFCVYMTGLPNSKVHALKDELPENLIITGYLSAEEFDSMLFSADAVIDLTFRNNCLVCGAYEAVAAGAPMILSETPALVNYFGVDGVIYAKNNAEDIARCIKDISEDLDSYREGVRKLKVKLLTRWENRKKELLKFIAK